MVAEMITNIVVEQETTCAKNVVVVVAAHIREREIVRIIRVDKGEDLLIISFEAIDVDERSCWVLNIRSVGRKCDCC